MTDKRFTYMEQFNSFCDVYDNGKVLSCMRLEYVEKTVKLLNGLYEENKELKERNNRQAKQLHKLYKLIEKQDWQTLKGIIQEFQECEEQLQSEWKCYDE